MSDGESIDQRRAQLSAEIARQRGELSTAYQNLSKPLYYTENAMRGFGFLRQNAWIFSAVPAVFTVGSALTGLVNLWKGKEAAPSRLSRSQQLRLAQIEKEETERASKGFAGKLLKWSGHGWRAFKLYRRFRRYLP